MVQNGSASDTALLGRRSGIHSILCSVSGWQAGWLVNANANARLSAQKRDEVACELDRKFVLHGPRPE